MHEVHMLDRQAKALGRIACHDEKRLFDKDREPSEECPCTIALSREAGTPAAEVATQLGRLLGWPVFDHEILTAIARELGLDVHLLEHFDERSRSWLLECIESFVAAPKISEEIYVQRMCKVIRGLAGKRSCIIVGRGAAHFLPPESTLRVRLAGTWNDRVEHLSRQLRIDGRDAASRLQELDHERKRFIKEHFQKDPTDPHQFDLIVNTSRWSIDTCADVIARAARRLQAECVMNMPLASAAV